MNQQIETCQRFVQGLQSLPPEKRRAVELERFEADLAAAMEIRQQLAFYRTEVATALERQKQIMAQLRATARCSLWFMDGQFPRVEGDIIAAGLELEKSKRVRTGPPGVPRDLRARSLNGVITLLWKSPMRRSIFNVQCAEDTPKNGWRKPIQAVKARHTFKNLVPGKLYWFRVMAWNPNGKSDWSAPIQVRAI